MTCFFFFFIIAEFYCIFTKQFKICMHIKKSVLYQVFFFFKKDKLLTNKYLIQNCFCLVRWLKFIFLIEDILQ